MILSFRWYGAQDAVSLAHIRQIPGVRGIVTALYDVPVGEVWPVDKIRDLRHQVESCGMEISVIESVPVHEEIKLGQGERDRYIENFNQTLRNLAKSGIETVCYNFMPVFDWTRSSLAFELADGSTALSYEEEMIGRINPASGSLELPGWDTSYRDGELPGLLERYREIEEEDLWTNLAYFLQAVIPVAQEVGIKMAIHPDDPPWSVFGLPRIVTDQASLERIIEIYDSPSNGLCICSGSLGANPDNDVPGMLRYFGELGKVNFVHARNIRTTKLKTFHETAHPSSEGDIDMFDLVQAMSDVNFQGPIRPDHGRMIWGERGRPGYGLYDRALGVAYLNGLWEAICKGRPQPI
jgi:mannonate dehydratase